MQQAFYNCDKLTGVIIPEGVAEIGEWAFADCNNLSRVVIPESITKIEATAFQYCSELKTIEIPKNCIYEPEDPFIQIIRRSK
ncbi:MAG: leucine-rich repeat domain-containing protein [Phascolarctobacterium sp.]|nr:leucine-rich repeat domain-containing protein [Phascolarctobacterium sp.]